MSDEWFEETLHDGVEVSYKCDRMIHREKSDHQDLALFENKVFGKVLMLDGVTQVTTSDEFIYHEMMAHVPILAHGAAHAVAIVGGGDCGLAEEVLKHASVQQLTQIEIDASVVDFSKEHFADFNAGVFDDPRFDLKIADGAQFFAETDKRFDVVIIDSTDPIGPGEILFSAPFYQNVHRCLKPGGVAVSQNGVPFFQSKELVTAISRLAHIYADVTAYVAAIPTYFGGHMTLGWASDDPQLRQTPLSLLQERFARADLSTRYYTPEVHQAAFALPRFIADLVEGATKRAP